MAGLKQRGSIYYLTYYVNGKKQAVSLDTDSLQLAKEKQRQFESAQARGGPSSLPTRTPIPEVLAPYVEHLRATKTPKSAQTDVYYLRDLFGPVCAGLKIVSRKVGLRSRKCQVREGQDRRRRAQIIEAPWFESISTATISAFIHAQVLSRGISGAKSRPRAPPLAAACGLWANADWRHRHGWSDPLLRHHRGAQGRWSNGPIYGARQNLA